MVVLRFSRPSWLPAFLTGAATTNSRSPTLDILSFEAARTMSLLVSLHRALSDPAVAALRSSTLASPAVATLISPDPARLLRLAAAELLQDLDRAAASVSRLAARCSRPWPRGFPQAYSDLKSASADFPRRIGFEPASTDRKMRKMESYVAATEVLHLEMEVLAEMEASERKLDRWKNYSGPIPSSSAPPAQSPSVDPPGAEAFRKKLEAQRRVVKRLQGSSLWEKSYEKVAELMANAVVTIFVRICQVFSPDIADLPVVDSDRHGRFRVGPNQQRFRVYPRTYSGPLERPAVENKVTVHFSGPIHMMKKPPPLDSAKPWTARALEAPPTTVGGSGLALRYADIIELVEKMFESPEIAVGEEMRQELYQMLPDGIRAAMKSKMRKIWQKPVEEEVAEEQGRRAMGWLAPMAHDTVRWYSERNCERQRFEPGPRALMVQTLQMADRRKVEAAIVDILVGLSLVCHALQGDGSGGDVTVREEWG